MKIIEIKPMSNGSHRNQTIEKSIPIPDGYAVIDDDMYLPNFPFGYVVVEEINGIMTVVDWIPGIMPEKDSEEEL